MNFALKVEVSAVEKSVLALPLSPLIGIQLRFARKSASSMRATASHGSVLACVKADTLNVDAVSTCAKCHSC